MGTVGLFVTNGMGATQLWAQPIAGGALTPTDIPKWRTPMLIPPQMPLAGVLLNRDGLIDYYEIAVRRFAQQILPDGMPATTVWATDRRRP